MDKDFLTGLKFEDTRILGKTKEIYDTVLGRSRYFNEGNYRRFCSEDLTNMFELYDTHFFDGLLGKVLGDRISFDLSKRMTHAAGKTIIGKDGSMVIRLSMPLLFQTFKEDRREIFVNGKRCQDRLEASMKVVEHEMVHVAEHLAFGTTNCRGSRFMTLAWNIFGHTEVTHQLVTAKEIAWKDLGIRVGTMVSFTHEGTERKGFVNRITKRATVMVRSSKGALVDGSGRRFAKYYVPLDLLRPMGRKGGDNEIYENGDDILKHVKMRDRTFQLRIELLGSEPAIWRVVRVRGDTRLDILNDIIQIAMGWQDSHLHLFNVGDRIIGDPNLDLPPHRVEDELDIVLGDIVKGKGSELLYEYDFIDKWTHRLIVEKVLDPKPGEDLPICTGGAMAGPPEECGGVEGYAEMLQILDDPDHPEYEEVKEEAPEDLDPGTFDMEEINRFLEEEKEIWARPHQRRPLTRMQEEELEMREATLDRARIMEMEDPPSYENPTVVRLKGHKNPFLVLESFCENPECICNDMFLQFVETLEGKLPIKDAVMFKILLDLDTFHVKETETPKEDRARPVQRLVDKFLDDLTNEQKTQYRRHYQEGKEWGRRAAKFARRLDIEDIEDHLSFAEAFGPKGSIFDEGGAIGSIGFIFDHDGQRFFIEDRYCIDPDCDCEAVYLTFHTLPEGSRILEEIFSVELPLWDGLPDLRDGETIFDVEEPFEETNARDLFKAWMDPEPDMFDRLGRRYREMRKIGELVLERLGGDPREDELEDDYDDPNWDLPGDNEEIERLVQSRRPAPSIPRSGERKVKVGRNDPCPCGSGKKYKKCCGGPWK